MTEELDPEMENENQAISNYEDGLRDDNAVDLEDQLEVAYEYEDFFNKNYDKLKLSYDEAPHPKDRDTFTKEEFEKREEYWDYYK